MARSITSRLPDLPVNASEWDRLLYAALIDQFADVQSRLGATEETLNITPKRAKTGFVTSPLTVKGDLWGFSTADTRLAVGADSKVLQADSAAAAGVSWTTVTGTGNVVRADMPYLTFPTLLDATLTDNYVHQNIDGTASRILVTPTSGIYAIAWPNAPTTLVGRDTSDTLTNKTFDSTSTGYRLANLTDSAWTAYTPTITAGSGTFTTVSATGKYKDVGKIRFVEIVVSITSAGTAAGYVRATHPATTNNNAVVNGVEVSSNLALTGRNPTNAGVDIYKYDGTYRGSTGDTLLIHYFYEL